MQHRMSEAIVGWKRSPNTSLDLISTSWLTQISAFTSPAPGEVVAVNSRTLEQPWTVTRDPYGVGWVLGLWTRDHNEAIKPLRIGSAATAFLRQEMQRLNQQFIRQAAGSLIDQGINKGLKADLR